jgi:hypothetical protein
MGGNIGFVSYDNDGLPTGVKFVEQREDFGRRL